MPTKPALKSCWRAVLAGLLVSFALSNCVTVAPYERMQLNDADMKLSAGIDENFELNNQAYREAASGANGGKAGGGCGCN